MEPLFQFIGSYWWLVFPLVGMMGGIGTAWERAARQRHKRRLEMMKVKAELKASQAAARGKKPSARVVRAQQTTTENLDRVQPMADRIARVEKTYGAVTKRWLDYELDVEKLIKYPAMSDGRQPLTAAFLRAKKVADGLKPTSPAPKVSEAELVEYRNAVTDYEVAFDVAEREARRVKNAAFSPAEKKRLDTAQQLLTVAVDKAATPAERHLAYKRVRQELDGLISISDEAIDVLEQKVSLEISPTPAAPPAAETSRTAPTTPAPAPAAGTWPVPSRTAKPPRP